MLPSLILAPLPSERGNRIVLFWGVGLSFGFVSAEAFFRGLMCRDGQLLDLNAESDS